MPESDKAVTNRLREIFTQAREQKAEDAAKLKRTVFLLSFLAKAVVLFVQSSIVYLGYYTLQSKVPGLIQFTFPEFLLMMVSVYTTFSFVRNFFRPFNIKKLQ